jgi:hypothetical protein
MKANELRIGNYVNVPNSEQCPFRIDDFECLTYEFIKVGQKQIINGKEVHPFTWYGKDLQPIPLTEEWLIKFGFSREVKVGSEMGTDGVEFRVYHFDVLTFNTNHGWWYKVQRINDTPLEYVHQLQNLYFALTGEELTLNS